MPIGEQFSKKGYNVLIPSMRACGESDGEYLGMGWLEKDDLQNWINLIIEENKSKNYITWLFNGCCNSINGFRR